MRRRSARKNPHVFSNGIVHVVPLLLVAVLVVGVLAATSFRKQTSLETIKEGVLSKRDELKLSDEAGDLEVSDKAGDFDRDKEENEDHEEDRKDNKDHDEEEKRKEKIEIEKGDKKIRIETKNGEAVIKIEGEEDHELREGEEVEIHEEGEQEGIKIKKLENGFVVARNKVGALSRFPVSVDPTTGELTIITPAGEKVVTILPDDAVENILAANIFDRVLGKFSEEASERVEGTSPASPKEERQEVEITITDDGKVAYEVEGVKEEKFLGIIDVLVPKVAVVSADTGEVIALRQNFLSRLLDILSF